MSVSLYPVLMASQANWTQESSFHNHKMIVGDGQGLVKTKGGHFKWLWQWSNSTHLESESVKFPLWYANPAGQPTKKFLFLVLSFGLEAEHSYTKSVVSHKPDEDDLFYFQICFLLTSCEHSLWVCSTVKCLPPRCCQPRRVPDAKLHGRRNLLGNGQMMKKQTSISQSNSPELWYS